MRRAFVALQRVLVLVLALALALGAITAAAAHAQVPAPIDPSGTLTEDRVLTYDRSSLPASVTLWAPRTALGFSDDLRRAYGRIHLTCRSDVDAGTGRCAIADTLLTGAGSTDITLRFVERRSGLRTELIVRGSLQRVFNGRQCHNGFWDGIDRPLTTSAFTGCAGRPPSGTGAELTIDAAELSKLVAGRWDAELILDLRTDPNAAALATYVWRFDVSVTDRDSVSIYFPEFDRVTPLVGLDLRYDPLAGTVGGRTMLDMCLYDGLGSQSGFLGVTLTDTGPNAGSGPGYAVQHEDGVVDAGGRLDYTVTLDHQGTALHMANGVEQILTGIDSARLRLVLLPGTNYPVYCVPTPLSLTTPAVPITGKRAGHYTGALRVDMRLPASRP